MEELNSYELSRDFFNWSYENPELISPTHVALYFFIIEHYNRMGKKGKFGLPTTMAKEAIGIKNYKTYSNTLNDLISWGFIKLIERSKNQYSSNIVAMVKNTKAHTKALTKASLKHIPKQVQSIVSITKPNNLITYEPIKETESVSPPEKFDFKNEFLKMNVEDQILNDWLIVRKSKKASNTETSFNSIKSEIEKSGLTANECIKISAERNWVGFKNEWLQNKDSKQSKGASDNWGNYKKGTEYKIW